MSQHTLTQGDLDQFTGTEVWYRHWIKREILYTDGVKYLAETGGAYWLLDEIVLAQRLRQVEKEEFQVWKLQRIKREGSLTTSAYLSCEDGNGHQVWIKGIEFTDFPLPATTVWLTNSVMLLPSEH